MIVGGGSDIQTVGTTDQENAVEVVNGTLANPEPTDQESLGEEVSGIPANPKNDLTDMSVEVYQYIKPA